MRLFNGITNDKMLTGAETMRDLFEKDQSLFEAFDSSLNDAFKSDWDNKIDAARGEPSDETVTNGIEEFSAVVQDAWEACKIHFEDSKYFIEKAFPDNATQHGFGFKGIRAMSRNQDKVIPFMDQFHGMAEKNKVALLANGYTQAKIDAIETLAETFRNAQRLQENEKKDRPLKTKNRVEKINAVWKMLQKVNRASKRVFKNDFAKRKAYLLPRINEKK